MKPEQHAILHDIALIIWWRRNSKRWQEILAAHWADFEALQDPPLSALDLLELETTGLAAELEALGAQRKEI